ncbi:hypothetical protein BH23PAT2_BH23PAT2_03190 [soil metagenome]
MKKRSSNKGYTIIEVMIFIVVSAFILVSAIAMFGGRQNQIQYEQGVRNFSLKIAEVTNSVSNGHFPDTGYSCTKSPGGDLTFTFSPGAEQGTHDGCVFAGWAIERDSETSYRLTTIAAARPDLGATMAVTDPEARLTPLTAASETIPTSWGLKINKIADENGLVIKTILFLSDLGSGSSGNQNVGLYTSYNAMTFPINGDDLNRGGPVYICLESAATDEKQAVIILGLEGRELTTTIDQDAKEEYTPQCD